MCNDKKGDGVLKHGNLLKEILLCTGKAGARLFPNNVGFAWTGNKVKKNKHDGSITIFDPRPFRGGLCVGSLDLIGWDSVIVTQEMVGERVAIFVAIDGKVNKDKLSPEQTRFVNAVLKNGGKAGAAYSLDEAMKIIKK